MADYTAIEKVRKINKEKYGIDGPVVPPKIEKTRYWKKIDRKKMAAEAAEEILEKFQNNDGKQVQAIADYIENLWKSNDGEKEDEPTFDDISDMENDAIDFIRENCINLRFEKKYADCTDSEGTSLSIKQIPYNMEKDLDRRCLEISIHRFLESGSSKDAFDIYFCFFEMFLGKYNKTKTVIEMLSEFEANASALLMKHRDHYSHSAYVFIMGLAVYRNCQVFRNVYKEKYINGLEPEAREHLTDEDTGENYAAAHFLKYWGITSLLHDIGYPFELTFEQVKSYFGNTIDYVPFVKFDMNGFNKNRAYIITEKIDSLIKELESRKLNKKKCRSEILDIINGFYGKKRVNFKDDTPFGIFYSEDFHGNVKDFIEDKIIGEKFTDDMCRENALKFLNEIKKSVKERTEQSKEFICKLCPKMKNEADEKNDDLNVYLATALEEDIDEKYEDYVGFKKYKEKHKEASYRDYLINILENKNSPEKFNGFIDHAYFSAIMLIECLFNVIGKDGANEMFSKAITAILMHNSMYKFSITNYKDNDEGSGFNNGKHFTMEMHPLAFLLMLCDEIQCWDRTSYGQSSRGELHPINCELVTNGNNITATYIFNAEQAEKQRQRNKRTNKKDTYLKIESGEFLKDIENIVSINGDESSGKPSEIKLDVKKEERADRRYRSAFLSASNYIHFYKFAIMVYLKNNKVKKLKSEGKSEKEIREAIIEKISEQEIEKGFEGMSLEYKLYNIGRVKKFARYLNEIGCFYTDRPVDMEQVLEFDKKALNNTLGPLEHERWCWEHYIMGWRYDDKYNNKDFNKYEELKNEYADFENEEERYNKYVTDIREKTKTHICMPRLNNNDYQKDLAIGHFYSLEKTYQLNDTMTMDNLLEILESEDGIKIYKLK